MVDEWTKVLIGMSPFFELKPPVGMSRHHGHILEVTRPAFIAYCAIVRVIGHEPFNNMITKFMRFRILN